MVVKLQQLLSIYLKEDSLHFVAHPYVNYYSTLGVYKAPIKSLEPGEQ